MPAWDMHLIMAKRINEKLKQDNDIFYYANILPDYLRDIIGNDAHLNKRIMIKKSNLLLPDYNGFISNYKKDMYNPLVIGMFTHILMDYYFNKYMYENVCVMRDGKIKGVRLYNKSIIKIKNEDEFCDIKQKDFIMYANYININNQIYEIKDIDKVYENVKIIGKNLLSKEELSKQINYLNRNRIGSILKYKLSKNKTKILTIDNYNKLMDDCYYFILDVLRTYNIL